MLNLLVVTNLFFYLRCWRFVLMDCYLLIHVHHKQGGGGGFLRLIYGGPKCWMMLLCINYIYSYFIVPYLNYCCEIWSNTFNSITKPLFLLQDIEWHFEFPLLSSYKCIIFPVQKVSLRLSNDMRCKTLPLSQQIITVILHQNNEPSFINEEPRTMQIKYIIKGPH